MRMRSHKASAAPRLSATKPYSAPILNGVSPCPGTKVRGRVSGWNSNSQWTPAVATSTAASSR